MKGLMRKEWYLILTNSGFLLIAVELLAVSALFHKDYAVLVYLPFLIGSLPAALMAVDENCRWEQYSFCMPYSRKQIVSAKYLVVLLMGILSAVCTVLFGSVIKQQTSTTILLAAGMFAVAALPSAFMLPVNFWFGSAKSRVFMLLFICCGGTLATTALKKLDFAALVSKVQFNGALSFLNQVIQQPDAVPVQTCLVLLFMIGLFMLISWIISVIGYNHRTVG